MPHASAEFVNEIGNRIRISVSESPEGDSAVRVSMAGPNSEVENFMTVVEVVQLYLTIGEFLRRHSVAPASPTE